MVADAGWFPDPEGRPCERYWDGTSWTGYTRPLTVPAPPDNGTKAGETKFSQNEILLLALIGVIFIIVMLA